VAPLAVAADPASATARISDLEADGHQLRFVLSVHGLAAGSDVDTSSIRVRAGGRALTARAATDASRGSAEGPLPPREAMLVVDTSGSMKGSRLAAAKRAALTYARTLPADVTVGLVNFSARPALRLAPTGNRVALRTAVSRLVAQGDTALYDGARAAVAAFGRRDAAVQRRMLILSDGADTASRHSLSAATTSIAGSGIGVDAVGIDLTRKQRAVLDRMTTAGSGRILPVSGLAELDSAFVRAAQTFSRQVTVTADIPPGLAGKTVAVVAAVTAGGHTLRASSRVHLASLGATAPARGGTTAAAPREATPRLPLVVLGLAFLGLLATGLVVATPKSTTDPKARIEQLDAYQWSVPMASAAVPAADGQVATAALSLVDRLIRPGPSRSRIASGLEQAGVRMRPQEWVLVRIAVAVVAVAALSLLSGSVLTGAVAGTLAAWLGTRFWLNQKAARRCAAFADQLPDVLQLVASSLRSGFTLPQALEAVVHEGDQPAAGELTRALTEARLGVKLEDALDQVSHRTRSQDLAWVVMAVRISRDVGGNLAEVLLTTVHTMRERGQLRRQVRALSAEGRLSGYILVGLPIAVAGWLALVRPEYLRPLYTDSAGIVMLVIAVLGIVVGSWWMSRIVKVEV
jgi:tight adherence protein B